MSQSVVVGDAPRWHTGHFDAVLDHPELFGRRKISFAPKFRRAWIKTLADLRSLHTGRKTPPCIALVDSSYIFFSMHMFIFASHSPPAFLQCASPVAGD